ncbi:astacin-like [Macrosteles quadrilineatus]|uniref:astacin-like n=1 Tax=Macrosteles quadrilineatus TaxID=74068 RepID=UPI0023E1B9DD|nr:astacin-like [Macrosteles quadrilineatus]
MATLWHFLYFLLIVALSQSELQQNTMNEIDQFGESQMSYLNIGNRINDYKYYEHEYKLWPLGVVPYTFNEKANFSISDKKIILGAMRIIEDVLLSRKISDRWCQIKFVPKKSYHKDYVEIFNNGPGKCFSNMGYVTGKQVLSLGEGCIDTGNVIHELCHTLGMVHEHQAPFRDNYVKVHWENIKKETLKDYTINHGYRDFGLEYDYKSIMHYDSHALGEMPSGKWAFVTTMTARDPSITLVRNEKLSYRDKIKLELMYCPTHTQVVYPGYILRYNGVKLRKPKETNMIYA